MGGGMISPSPFWERERTALSSQIEWSFLSKKQVKLELILQIKPWGMPSFPEPCFVLLPGDILWYLGWDLPESE